MSDRLRDFTFILIAVFLSSVSLRLTKGIMIPFILSVFLAFILEPMIAWIKRRFKIGGGLAILLLCILMIGLSAIFFLTLSSSVRQLIENANVYEQRFTSLITKSVDLMSHFDAGFDREELKGLVKELPIFSALKTISNTVVKSVSDFFLVAIFTIFILSGPKIKLPNTEVWSRINKSVRTYLVTKFVTSAATGVLTAIILKIVNLDMALMFGLLAFILNFIPTFGSIFATLLPIPIVLLQFSNPILILVSIGLPGLVQFTIGNVLEPKIMGKNLDLHPVTVLMSLMFWGVLWGIPGMLLATPITVIIKIVLESQESTQGFANGMAGRF
ncbi:AI-2E family transporter [Pseudobacteriovorax antillogorgiicola]|nr:AI-2E family transporter [Pseudobacteriovorax antillogorgiicola]